MDWKTAVGGIWIVLIIALYLRGLATSLAGLSV